MTIAQPKTIPNSAVREPASGSGRWSRRLALGQSGAAVARCVLGMHLSPAAADEPRVDAAPGLIAVEAGQRGAQFEIRHLYAGDPLPPVRELDGLIVTEDR